MWFLYALGLLADAERGFEKPARESRYGMREVIHGKIDAKDRLAGFARFLYALGLLADAGRGFEKRVVGEKFL